MKKFILLMAAVAGLFILAGCADSPQDVAKKYAVAIGNRDLGTANSFCTKNMETKNKFIVAMKRSNSTAKEIENICEDIDEARVDKNDTTAKIYIDEEKDPIVLVKVDGEWKVDKY